MRSFYLSQNLASCIYVLSELIFVEKPDVTIVRKFPKPPKESLAEYSDEGNWFQVFSPMVAESMSRERKKVKIHEEESVIDILFRIAAHEVRHQIQHKLKPEMISSKNVKILTSLCRKLHRYHLEETSKGLHVYKARYSEWLKSLAECLEKNYPESKKTQETDAELVADVCLALWRKWADLERVKKCLLIGCDRHRPSF